MNGYTDGPNVQHASVYTYIDVYASNLCHVKTIVGTIHAISITTITVPVTATVTVTIYYFCLYQLPLLL